MLRLKPSCWTGCCGKHFPQSVARLPQFGQTLFCSRKLFNLASNRAWQLCSVRENSSQRGVLGTYVISIGLNSNKRSSPCDVLPVGMQWCTSWRSKHAPLACELQVLRRILLFRGTERLWENWLTAVTGFPSPRCNMTQTLMHFMRHHLLVVNSSIPLQLCCSWMCTQHAQNKLFADPPAKDRRNDLIQRHTRANLKDNHGCLF